MIEIFAAGKDMLTLVRVSVWQYCLRPKEIWHGRIPVKMVMQGEQFKQIENSKDVLKL